MDDVENIDEYENDEIFDVEVVETNDEDHADALASLANKGLAEDALGAMAAGQVEAPVDAIAAAEARQDGQAEEALASLAGGEPLAEGPADEDPPAAGEDQSDPANEYAFAENEHIHVDPERIRTSRKQHQRLADSAESLSFRKTMTPLLLVVGVLLLCISGITAVMKGDPAAADATAMDTYGTPMMVASLVLGLVLLAGAVLFHVEIRRAQKQNDRQDS